MKYLDLLKVKRETQKQINKKDLLENYMNKEYKEKITNLSIELGISEEEIIKEIKANNPFCIHILAKNISRQNISEKLFFEYISEVDKKPQSGKNAIRFSKDCKAVDFTYQDWYGTQKFTNEEGGSQDNQYSDVIMFLETGIRQGRKVMACVDGDYWYKRMSELKKQFCSENVLIFSADELKNWILTKK